MYPCNPKDPEILNGGLPSAATARPPPRCQAWLPSQSNRTTPPSMSSPCALHRSPFFEEETLSIIIFIKSRERADPILFAAAPPNKGVFYRRLGALKFGGRGGGAKSILERHCIDEQRASRPTGLGHRRYEADRRAGGRREPDKGLKSRFYFIRAGRRTERGECCSQKDTGERTAVWAHL